MVASWSQFVLYVWCYILTPVERIQSWLRQNESSIFLPISRGDSFLLLVLCGDAPCSSRTLTLSSDPASVASTRAVSPSTVFSSRVKSKCAIAATQRYSDNTVVFHQWVEFITNGSRLLTLQYHRQDVRLCLRGSYVQRQPALVVALGKDRRAIWEALQCAHVTLGGHRRNRWYFWIPVKQSVELGLRLCFNSGSASFTVHIWWAVAS